ncbi:MAG: tyrosine-type recombinase/integrase [Ruminiclostridium sp.]|uniref:tyrosine-type recombinase/integrase n=1 Tax=Ruminococcus sp. TaxID=41978 RepID=UPI0026012A7C|nr:site-specific integrase [Ruminococcus sp.]MBR1433027.1 tyrosine-type recombinase/integrase [Ruminococcus sp.]MBR1831066.1 tyrosine-type recombinase/integrase [Ruminiclostridium sp.]
MASISKRGDSYRITVSCGIDGKGKHIRKYLTFTPPPGLTPKQTEKAVNQAAIEFEQKCLHGDILDQSVRFKDFAERWLEEYGKPNLKSRTFDRYKGILKRLNIAFGNMKLSDIRPHHLNAFYVNLTEEGVREDLKLTPLPVVTDLIENHPLPLYKIAKEAGIALNTTRNIKQLKRVNEETAEKFSDYFEKHVSELFAIEDKRLSDSTIRYYHAVLSSLLNTAVIWQVIPSNPCERVKPPKVTEKESRYLNEYETADLLAALEDEPIQYAVAVKLLIFTGLRRGELCGLEWQDIDFINNKLSVKRTSLYSVERGVFVDTPKTKKSMRTITLPTEAVTMLKEYRAWQEESAAKLGTAWKGSNRLFTTWDGAPIHPDTLSGWFHGFVQRKQLPDICLHSLRHTSATLLIAAGTPLKVVSDRLGHGSLSTTGNIYVHQIQSAEAAAAETISAMIEKGRSEKGRKIG